jgi:hypothetical protein
MSSSPVLRRVREADFAADRRTRHLDEDFPLDDNDQLRPKTGRPYCGKSPIC